MLFRQQRPNSGYGPRDPVALVGIPETRRVKLLGRSAVVGVIVAAFDPYSQALSHLPLSVHDRSLHRQMPLGTRMYSASLAIREEN